MLLIISEFMNKRMVEYKRKYLFLSIKPEFAKKIMAGQKTIELRKLRPHISIGDYVIIYASTPLRKVIGYARIKSIIECSPAEMWSTYHNSLGIDEARFAKYYSGHSSAIGIELEKIHQCRNISLEQLRMIDSNFRPPQGFRYISDHQIYHAINEFFNSDT